MSFVISWIPSYAGEPFPQTVVLQTYARSYAKASVSPAGTCQVANSFDGATDTYGVQAGTQQHVSTYSDTQVLPGQSKYEFEADLSSSAFSAFPSVGDTGAGFGITITATPVQIQLSNVASDSSGNSVLVGKKVTGAPYISLSGTYATFSDVQWTVSGSRIKDFAVEGGLDSPTQTPNYGGPVALGTSDLHVLRPSWYWWKPGLETVSCTGIINVDGVTTSFSATVDILVKVPDILQFDVVTVNKEDLLSTFTTTNNGARYVLDSHKIDGSNAMRFTGSVNYPPEPNLGAGKWFFLQLVQRRESSRYEAIGSSLPPIDTPYPSETTAPWRLDGNLAYGYWDYGAAAKRSVGPNTFEVTDSPNYSLPANISVNGTTFSLTRMGVLWSGKMFLMYQPPGQDSIPVPLRAARWNWRAYQASPFPADETQIDDSAVDIAGYLILPLEFPQWNSRFPYVG